MDGKQQFLKTTGTSKNSLDKIRIYVKILFIEKKIKTRKKERI